MISASDLADRLDLTKHPRSWRGQCPACNYAGNTLSVKVSKEGRTLLWCANGCSQADLQQAVSAWPGTSWTAPEKPSDAERVGERQRKQDAAHRLWLGSEPATGSPVATYLAARGLAGQEHSRALRFRGDTSHPEHGGRWMAMVAEVLDHAGTFLGVHRTYLCRDGTAKAAVEPNRASLGPIWGGSVRLDPVAPELVVGEGIESSASAGRLMSLPAWAALSAGNLAKGLVLPPEVRNVIIAADHDRAGQDAAEAARRRWMAEGRAVRTMLPDRPGADFNDVLRERLHA